MISVATFNHCWTSNRFWQGRQPVNINWLYVVSFFFLDCWKQTNRPSFLTLSKQACFVGKWVGTFKHCWTSDRAWKEITSTQFWLTCCILLFPWLLEARKMTFLLYMVKASLLFGGPFFDWSCDGHYPPSVLSFLCKSDSWMELNNPFMTGPLTRQGQNDQISQYGMDY